MPANDYSLSLRTNPAKLSAKTDECAVVETITDYAGVRDTWRREFQYYGGADLGTFTVFGTTGELNSIWESWMGLDVVEVTAGIKTWNGQIRKMEYHTGSIGFSLDMNVMANKVKASYNGGEGYSTWAENVYSQNWYGTREEIIESNASSAAQALYSAKIHLAWWGWPKQLPVGKMRKLGQPPFIKVWVNGYCHSINDTYLADSFFGTNPTLSTMLTDICNDSAYITPRKIDTNSTQYQDDTAETRGWDAIMSILTMSESNNRLYRGFVDENRNFNYIDYDTTPSYYVKRGIAFTDAGASVSLHPRQLQPGVYRVMDWPVPGPNRGAQASPPTDILERREDVLIEKIMVDEEGEVHFTPKGSAVSEYLKFLDAETTDSEYEQLYDWPAQQEWAENNPEEYAQHSN